MAFSTAFQSNAFQASAFQIIGQQNPFYTLETEVLHYTGAQISLALVRFFDLDEDNWIHLVRMGQTDDVERVSRESDKIEFSLAWNNYLNGITPTNGTLGVVDEERATELKRATPKEQQTLLGLNNNQVRMYRLIDPEIQVAR